jgi:biotin carboxyl carrier protein
MQEPEKFQIIVNGSKNFELDGDDLDWRPTGQGTWHILLNGKGYTAELLHTDFQEKYFELRINGSNFKVKLADRFDQLIEKMGLSKQASAKIKDIKAPMPGLVLEIQVEVGQEVSQGQSLLILEAMKMENIIKSPGDGIVRSIHVEKGNPVEKNHLLIELD